MICLRYTTINKKNAESYARLEEKNLIKEKDIDFDYKKALMNGAEYHELIEALQDFKQEDESQ